MQTDLIDRFHAYVSIMIDSEGVYPHPGMSIDKAGKLEIAALCEPDTAFDWFWNQVTIEQSQECIFGLDRSTKPGQGTEFQDVLTCIHWAEGMDGKPWAYSFRIGVINYRCEPRLVRAFDFENHFWIEKMTGEAISFRPPIRMVVNTARKSDALPKQPNIVNSGSGKIQGG